MNASDTPSSQPHLLFDAVTPLATQALGGLPRDHFSNGRLFATLASHGGITELSYWGHQHLGASHFFRGDQGTAWVKLFRLSLKVDGARYYPVLKHTELFPFGLRGRGEVGEITFSYELLLLPDALVQRVKILDNPRQQKIGFEILHQEEITAIARAHRTWADFEFSRDLNALVTSCVDDNPASDALNFSLAQQDLSANKGEVPSATTWIALGSDLPLSARRGYHPRSKHYLETSDAQAQEVAAFVVFATTREGLERRLRELPATVHGECAGLIAGYEARLASRPHIHTGRAVVDSAFGQYPEVIEHLKVPDRPGAVRATQSGYFVWGWDGMMPLFSSPLANEAAYAGDILRFFQQTLDPEIGLPHRFTSTFESSFKTPFPAQAQFLAGLYLYTATTGDLEVAREVWPTCEFILARCRERKVRDTGLVAGIALWPDFPEAMEETGEDISSMNNSMLYQGLRSVEYLAAALGKADLARECRQWARTLRVSFRKYFYDEEQGFFISSCSAVDLTPRKHYALQSVFWLSSFARELVSHAPRRIAAFMDRHLRSAKCLLTLPHWDTAWMADGNQLGSSFPAADSFYLGVHKLIRDDRCIEPWLGDIGWFWLHHTAPEAFTPEAENEHELGPDNTGTKQTQALTTWYAGAYHALAGLDFDHEGITLTPWGEMPLEVRGLRLHGGSLDLTISGRGSYLASLHLNGAALSPGLWKIPWEQLAGDCARLEWVRTEQAPDHPVVVRADGLRVTLRECDPRRLVAVVSGKMAGEVVIRANAQAKVLVNGCPVACAYDADDSTFTVGFDPGDEARFEVLQE